VCITGSHTLISTTLSIFFVFSKTLWEQQLDCFIRLLEHYIDFLSYPNCKVDNFGVMILKGASVSSPSFLLPLQFVVCVVWSCQGGEACNEEYWQM